MITVDFYTLCPCCSDSLGGFVTETGDLALNRANVKPWTVKTFNAPCEKCGSWVIFTLNPRYDLENISQIVDSCSSLSKQLPDSTLNSVLISMIGHTWEEFFDIEVSSFL